MKKYLLILLFVFLIPSFASAERNQSIKATFIRGDDLWLKINQTEVKLTNKEYIRYPKWSSNGNLVAYIKGTKSDFPLFNGELWIYILNTNKHIKLNSNVNNEYQWSPHGNSIGFMVEKTLYLYQTDSNKSFKVATNIENFSWLPDGSGFLTSSKESTQLHSDLKLSIVKWSVDQNKPKIKPFYTIPVDQHEYFVSTSPFKWSPDRKWISFLLIPTASLSADGNTLCILSSDGKTFQRVSEMLNDMKWMEWSPSRQVLGYINGVGREATSNKHLKLLGVPSFTKTNLTPKGFVDRDLVWMGNQVLYVSRSKESSWVPLDKRPLPSLYIVNLKANKQKRITFSSKHEGDFRPQIWSDKLFWVRTDRKMSNVLMSSISPIRENIWIQNIDTPKPYYEKWNWDEVFSVFGTVQ
ncbi:translocation protein TolB [Neobacillus sp. D3-1R]|uniref:translocation protein TolB n=1 Tax=Neobacillus sp. D3-1R TaxID=3445778 RepID=UPI003FA163CA